MRLPQIIFIVWIALALGIAMANHGKPREGKNNFLYSLVSGSLEVALLYWGGFFN